MTQPDAIEALSAELRKDIAAVWAAMVASQTALANDWYLLIPAVRVSRLAEFERVLRDLADQADAIAARHVTAIMKGAYEVGAFTAATTAEASSGARVVAAFGGIDVNAITVLAQDTYQDLLQATQYVRESTKDTVRMMARDQVRAKLYEGKTAIQSGKDLATQLLDEGITSVTYKNGRRVGLDVYSEMVARTKSAIAYQEGMFNQAAALGVKYMELMDGPGCGLSSHDDPVKANGLILPLEEARQYPISHPNCRRSSSCRADLETAEDVAAASPTEPMGQTAAQKKAAADYADAQARAPKRTARASKATAKTTSMTRDGVTQSAAERAHQKLVTPPT